MKFTFYHQHDAMDCGPACLQMVARHYGKKYRIVTLREKCFITRDGVSLLGISDAAEAIGFDTLGVQLSFTQLSTEAPLPCIAHWKQRHFVVVYRISQKRGHPVVYVADPAHGKMVLSKEEFLDGWLSGHEDEGAGICLALEPGEAFDQQPDETPRTSKIRFLIPYIKPRQRAILFLLLGMVAGSLIQLVFPFLTQFIVDKGIKNRDLSFITLVLLGQLALFIGLTVIEYVRGWVLLHLSIHINISLISDFLGKIMKLPIGFFDSKMIGDLMQRIQDHQRIQSFLTMSSLNVLFSTITFIIFGAVLLYYNLLIFVIFLIGSVLYALWVYLFMKKRRELDYLRFSRLSENQNTLIQMITGMQEIKLQNCEEQKRQEWETIQNNLYKLSIRSLSLNQYQSAGALFFVRTKDIFITFLTASLVIKGELTIGMMLSIQYILGQLNNPVEQMVNFIREAQDASISMERLEEVNTQKDEEDPLAPGINALPENRSITIEEVSFQREGPHSPYVLHNLSLVIPSKKVTAIVGSSGSGKTTLVKLLLGFYKPVTGRIVVGNTPLEDFSSSYWRSRCGSVMQDGYIFSDTIGSNIALSDKTIDQQKLSRAITDAILDDFINLLPMGTGTRIGQDGAGISEGQKQRILIARAIYRNPEYLFFDEATNSLDAFNERKIVENLTGFFQGKTVVLVAHRLSTIRHADQIVVLEKGEVVETGTHDELLKLKGYYYKLIRNQLELV
ncbi:MAG: peptidase domain-containing ABC transporter [Bacteroidota bacterium]